MKMQDIKKMANRYARNQGEGFVLLAIFGYMAFFVACLYFQSFEYEGSRVFPLHDDAMISMRYAQQLSLGRGLVWNEGERIQGYTNFLWTLYMALPHLFGFRYNMTGLFVQVSNLIINMVILCITWFETKKRANTSAAVIAVILLGISLPFT